MRYFIFVALIFLGTTQSAASSGWMGDVSKARITISVTVRTQIDVEQVNASPASIDLSARGLVAQSFCVRTNSVTNRYLVRAEFSGEGSTAYKLRWNRPNHEKVVLLGSKGARDFLAEGLALVCGGETESTFSLDPQDSRATRSPSKSELLLIIGPM